MGNTCVNSNKKHRRRSDVVVYMKQEERQTPESGATLLNQTKVTKPQQHQHQQEQETERRAGRNEEKEVAMNDDDEFSTPSKYFVRDRNPYERTSSCQSIGVAVNEDVSRKKVDDLICLVQLQSQVDDDIDNGDNKISHHDKSGAMSLPELSATREFVPHTSLLNTPDNNINNNSISMSTSNHISLNTSFDDSGLLLLQNRLPKPKLLAIERWMNEIVRNELKEGQGAESSVSSQKSKEEEQDEYEQDEDDDDGIHTDIVSFASTIELSASQIAGTNPSIPVRLWTVEQLRVLKKNMLKEEKH
eukprot:PhM_4_TR17406/c0_g1_i2/m.82200